MKKISIAVGSFILGLGIALPVGVFADEIKSLVGSKITGEYSVSVNGVKITDPAIVAQGKSHAPVRALADALGAKEIAVDNTNKTIEITVGDVAEDSSQVTSAPNEAISAAPVINNDYTGMSVAEVKKKRDYLINSVIPQTEKAIERYETELEDTQSLIDKDYLRTKISEANKDLDMYKAAVSQMDEVLKAE